MAARTGELLTAPTVLFGYNDGYGSIPTIPPTTTANQEGYGYPILASLPGSGISPIPHYLLACYDNLGNRHYWTDTSIQMTNAPSLIGASYTTSTLTVIAKT
jgi:hypothetical protein